MSVAVTIRLDSELVEQVDALAKAMDRSKTWIYERALQAYVAEQAWQIEEIQRAVAEADAGDFASETEVEAVFAKWRHAD